MRGKIVGIAFIFSIIMYIMVAYFLQGSIKPIIKINKDFRNYLYILSLLLFLFSLYFGKVKSFFPKIIAYAIAEVPVLLAFVFFILTKFIYPLYLISFIAILVMLVITFTKGDEVED